jgi:hypothetical protein
MPIVASVDYVAKRIYLNSSSVNTSIDTLEIYKEVRELRRTTEAHRKFSPMIIAGGNIEKLPGLTATPIYVQLLFGCRIVPFNSAQSIKLIRDTFTDDGFAGRDCFDRAGLTNQVDIDVDFSEVEIRYVNAGGGGGVALDEIVNDHQNAGSLGWYIKRIKNFSNLSARR